jgi:hypothetical protein
MFKEIMEHKRDLYFHLGLAKTGSTYLQNKFFNRLKGIKYIHTSRFYKYNKHIDKYHIGPLLFSREFDRQFEIETKKIADKYPEAKIIVVLRSNEQWIASQYKRYVKNGGSATFEKFIDIKENSGVWKIEDALFIHKLEFLRNHFINKPLILFYNNFKDDPYSFFDKIAKYTKTNYNKDSVSLSPKHKSYSEKQLLFLRKKNKKYFKKDPYYSRTKKLPWLSSKARSLILHMGLYIAAILPLKFDEKLISSELLKKYKAFFQEDWEACKQFAKQYSA